MCVIKTGVEKQSWQIDYREIRLGKRLGGGAFGDVYAGEWHEKKVRVV